MNDLEVRILMETLELSDLESRISEIIGTICKITGQSPDDVQTLIQEKIDSYKGLLTEEGAAHVVAQELGVTITQHREESVPTITVRDILSEMQPGTRGITVTGRVLQIMGPIEFERKDRQGKGILQSLTLGDQSGNIRTVIWGNHTRLISENMITRGTIIKIRAGYTRIGRSNEMELHVGDRSQIEILSSISQELEDKLPDPEDLLCPLDSLIIGEIIDTKGIITWKGEVRDFVRKDGTSGKNLSLRITDKTVNIRTILWDQHVDTGVDYTEGDNILFEGIRVREGLNNEVELHTVRSTRMTKLGHEEIAETQKASHLEGTDVVSVSKTISELQPGMPAVNVVFRVGRKGTLNSFNKKEGSIGHVRRVTIFDNTGITNLVLWDDDAVQGEDLNPNSIWKVENGYVKENRSGIGAELHLGRNGKLMDAPKTTLTQNPSDSQVNDLERSQGVVNFGGMVTEVGDLRVFSRSDGSEGQVLSITLMDGSGDSTRLVAWNDDVDKLSSIEEEQWVHISYANVRKRDDESFELHLGFESEVEVSSTVPAGVKLQAAKKGGRKLISELTTEETKAEVIAKVVRIFNSIPYYDACPECKKKVIPSDDGSAECEKHGEIDPEARARLSILLDDGSGTIRATVMGETAEKLTGRQGSELKDAVKTMEETGSLPPNEAVREVITKLREEIESNEFIFIGRVNLQQMAEDGEEQRFELFVNQIKEVDPAREAVKMLDQAEMEDYTNFNEEN